MSLPKVRQTKAGIPESRIGVRDDWVTASGAIEQTKKVIIKKCGMCLPKVRLTKAGISGSRVKVQLTKAGISGSRTPMRDDWVPRRSAG